MEENGISAGEDLMQRFVEIFKLNAIIDKVDSPSVIGLDSPWGTGKTTFIELWSENLRSSGYTVINYNAWKTDYVDDPLVAFVGEIESQIADNSGHAGKAKKHLEKIRSATNSLVKRSIPLAIKIISQGLLDIDGISNQLQKELANLSEGFSNDMVSDYLQKKIGVEKFKKTLSDFLKTVSPDKPVIFFIDELDRCRPDYAVRLLEVVKHFFDVPGIKFVLAIDREQLGYAVSGLYGEKYNGYDYLNRFIDIPISLNNDSIWQFIKLTVEKSSIMNISQRSTAHELDELPIYRNVIDSFTYCRRIFDLSLRDVLRMIKKIEIVLLVSSNDNAPLIENAMVFLMALQEKYPQKFHDYAFSLSSENWALNEFNRLSNDLSKKPDGFPNMTCVKIESELSIGKLYSVDHFNILSQDTALFVEEYSNGDKNNEYEYLVNLYRHKLFSYSTPDKFDSLLRRILFFADGRGPGLDEVV
jgi:hypothetical protein